MDDSTYARLLRLLDDGGATYRLIEHPAEGRTEVVSALRGNALRQAAKCIVLMVKLGKKVTRHVLAVVPGDRRVDLAAVKRLFGATYVAFVDQATAERLAGSVAGTVLPFSFSPDLELVVDPALLAADSLYFNAARLDRSLALSTADYVRLAHPRLEPIGAAPDPTDAPEGRDSDRPATAPALADDRRGGTYDIEMDVAYAPGTLIDIAATAAHHPVGWTNRTLAQVNDALVRLGVFEGAFHWHVHAREDEFFLVLEGQLWLDVEGRDTAILGPQTAFTVPRGVRHRPRAPERAIVLMIESAGVVPTGD
jgi:prolyl-tRNA editing enzyme YbaK/EbsC (Cys-tRNA(Pro) deacylase)/mannose-6-phosphate isomerase-like protein (cupin superfamily)